MTPSNLVHPDANEPSLRDLLNDPAFVQSDQEAQTIYLEGAMRAAALRMVAERAQRHLAEVLQVTQDVQDATTLPCPRCQAAVDLLGNFSEQPGPVEDVFDMGLICKECGSFYHSHYEDRATRAERARLISAIRHYNAMPNQRNRSIRNQLFRRAQRVHDALQAQMAIAETAELAERSILEPDIAGVFNGPS